MTQSPSPRPAATVPAVAVRNVWMLGTWMRVPSDLFHNFDHLPMVAQRGSVAYYASPKDEYTLPA